MTQCPIATSPDPEKIALISGEKKISYKELDCEISKMQSLFPLTKKSFVARRSVKTVAFIYAALREGACLLPLSSADPKAKEAIDPEKLFPLYEKKEPPLLKGYFALATSGSTGFAKRVIHSSKSYFERLSLPFYQKARRLQNSLSATALPLNHMGGWNALHSSLACHQTLYLTPSTKELFLVLDKLSTVAITPLHLEMILERKLKAPHLLIGAAKTPPEMIEKALLQGVDFDLAYGMSELPSIAFARPSKNPIFYPLEDVKVSLSGGILNLCCPALFCGYEEKMVCQKADKSFLTADRAQMEGDGFYLLSRQDKIVNHLGQKVDPDEIREALKDLPGIESLFFDGTLFLSVNNSFDPSLLERALKEKLHPHHRPKKVICRSKQATLVADDDITLLE